MAAGEDSQSPHRRDAGAGLLPRGARVGRVRPGHRHGPKGLKCEPTIDWEVLTKIYDGTGTPLALHGGTGLSDEIFRRDIRLGCAKVNISTHLNHVFVDDFVPHHQAPPSEYRPSRRGGLPDAWDVDLYGQLLQVGGGKERMRAYRDGAGWAVAKPAGRDSLEKLLAAPAKAGVRFFNPSGRRPAATARGRWARPR